MWHKWVSGLNWGWVLPGRDDEEERGKDEGERVGMMPSSGCSPECGFQDLEERVRIGRKQVGWRGGGESLLTSPDGSKNLSSLPILDLGGEVKDPQFQEQVPRVS